MSEQVVKWVTRSYEGTPIRTGRRAYNDPTADAAIGHVMMEERRRIRQQNSTCQQASRQKSGNWKERNDTHA